MLGAHGEQDRTTEEESGFYAPWFCALKENIPVKCEVIGSYNWRVVLPLASWWAGKESEAYPLGGRSPKAPEQSASPRRPTWLMNCFLGLCSLPPSRRLHRPACPSAGASHPSAGGLPSLLPFSCFCCRRAASWSGSAGHREALLQRGGLHGLTGSAQSSPDILVMVARAVHNTIWPEPILHSFTMPSAPGLS